MTKDKNAEESATQEAVNGPKIAANIINRFPAEHKERLLQSIQISNPEIATKIESNLWDINDLKELTAQSVQALVREVSDRDILLTLKRVDDTIKKSLLDNMSERKRAALLEELEALPPTPLREVEEAQRRVLAKLEYLRDEGKIKTESTRDIWV